MRRVIAIAATSVALTTAGIAEGRPAVLTAHHTPRASCAGAIGWQAALQKVGSYATVKGRVVGATYAASSNGSPTFLNLGVDYPNPRRFTVVIWGENRGRFGAPENRYRNRTICVRGLIDEYRGVAQIEATSPTQIALGG